MTNRPREAGKDGEPASTQQVTSRQPALTLGQQAQAPVSASAQDVNKPETSWIITQALADPQGQHRLLPPPLPTSAHQLEHDDDLEARVSHILSSTAHHLSTNTGKMALFPHKFIQRGPERKQPAFNTLSLSEHVFGVFMMIRDDRIPPPVKPRLYNHIQEIMEDTCHWATAVRLWSEEVFSQVAQGRLSWASTPAIQMLRMSMARASTARINHNDNNPRPAASAGSAYQGFNQNRPRFQQGTANDIFRGGPPCDSYNSPNGCNLPSGHIIRGKRMIHVCKFCLFNTSATNQHSEVNCNNKARLSNNHF